MGRHTLGSGTARRAADFEGRQQRVALARDAGFPRLSFLSALAGALVAYGLLAVLFGIVVAVAQATGFRSDTGTIDWNTVGAAGAIAVVICLGLAYLFGGYVAGRMGRRSGVGHGALVFIFGIIVAAAAAGIAAAFTNSDAVTRQLDAIGVPTTGSFWSPIATIGGIAAVVVMLAGALAGGALGERWHSKLVMRAMSPEYGPDVDDRPARERDHDRDLDRDRHDRDDRPMTRTDERPAVAAPSAPAPAASDHPTREIDLTPAKTEAPATPGVFSDRQPVEAERVSEESAIRSGAAGETRRGDRG